MRVIDLFLIIRNILRQREIKVYLLHGTVIYSANLLNEKWQWWILVIDIEESSVSETEQIPSRKQLRLKWEMHMINYA